ncbi:DNA gyrase subunit A [Lujinxingia vulgaris]|uniref:DNA gyrase subunit A n=1 Tax=Lujinxingia vulgaris TaxID=2600176 RepID=A0A5C6XF90_9DELT|nr:DNA gyrase subunit A [Lujinxingia vulgaris]TXD43498.1 DNA gyrase subunit A [Lujinxingia vulgaris]
MTDSVSIIPINIEEEIRQSYMDYAMSVIIGRALPDVRDGLKPVHRRILFAQHELGNRWNAAYKKSARIVGDVIGKYHPHGDSSVYDALVRLAQDFNMRVPLVDGQGNFGSVDGDPAAAMRYTEVRMARVAQELLSDIDKETVEWIPNYDDTIEEPAVLPTRIPNLLINGSSGIAVGMSTNIPPHNLGEVIRGTLALIENPEIDVEGLMQHIPGPDFPTAGIMYGARGLRDAYAEGRGIIKMRARAIIEEDEKRGKSSIVVTELPYQVNKARLIEKIAELARDKRLEGITDLRDESDRDGMRIVIELRRDMIPAVVLNNLYKMTAMQSSFGIIMLAIVHGQPRIMSLKEVLNHFIDFRRDVVTRRTIYELRKAEERAHILEGLKIALDHLDEVIALIRASASPNEAREGLMSRFALSERQSQAILDMRLQKLTGLERDKILEELAEVLAEIDRLRGILADEKKLMAVIVEELNEVLDAYADERRTEILHNVTELSDLDLIAEEDMVVTLSHAGYIKRTPLSEYRAQHRGGRGKRGMDTKDEDFVTDMFVASTHTNLLIFTSVGKVYKLMVHELPQGSRTTRGKAVVNLLPIEQDEKIKAILPFEEFEEGRYIVTATRQGVIKKTDLMAYANVHAGGIIALGFKDDNDELISVRATGGDDRIFLASSDGQAICFHEEDVRPMGRVAAGVYGMRFREGDTLVGMDVVPAGDDHSTILTITERGYGKRTVLDEYPLQRRGGKGVVTIKTNERNGMLVGIRVVDDTNELMMITDKGQVLRTRVEQISTYGRNTQGVRVMSLDDDELVVSIAALVAEEEDEELEGEALAEGGEGVEIQGDESPEEAASAGEESADDESGEDS